MGIKAKIKNSLSAWQLKLLSQESARRYVRDIASYAGSELPALQNESTPYETVATNLPEDGRQCNAVFITSRFRGGSTLLWNIFRQAEGFTAYYEPFNERRWFQKEHRGSNVDSTHRGVDDYWSEYSGLEDLGQFYNEDWTRYRFLMGPRDTDLRMRSYIDYMVTKATSMPVLQFNRVDFRLGWLKANYPDAKLIHLFRHPRDQWCSFLSDPQLMNKDDVERTYRDCFYLNRWSDDLSVHFPFLDRRQTPHPYQRFYYLWKLSYLFGKHYSDLSISFEELTRSPKPSLTKLFSILNVDAPPIEKLCSLIDAPKPDRWKNFADNHWFETYEQECEYQLEVFLAAGSPGKQIK